MKTFTESARNKFQEAIDYCGNQEKLAEQLSLILGKLIRQSHITKWRNKTEVIPDYVCRPIEQITKGLVKAHELRPDLWDAPKESEQSNAK